MHQSPNPLGKQIYVNIHIGIPHMMWCRGLFVFFRKLYTGKKSCNLGNGPIHKITDQTPQLRGGPQVMDERISSHQKPPAAAPGSLPSKKCVWFESSLPELKHRTCMYLACCQPKAWQERLIFLANHEHKRKKQGVKEPFSLCVFFFDVWKNSQKGSDLRSLDLTPLINLLIPFD